jgi:hypothetical protein
MKTTRFLLLAYISVSLFSGAFARELDAEQIGCGPIALFTLLRMEGKPVNLSEVLLGLPSSNAKENSLIELRDASLRFSLNLEAMQLPPNRELPEQPLIALMSNGETGHFVIVRRVGFSGKLVQVLDSSRETRVVDAEKLMKSPEWTGYVLVPARIDWVQRVAICVALMSGVLLAA